jgi:hypothetical protein
MKAFRALVRALLAALAAFLIGWGLWAAVTWLQYGHPPRSSRPDPILSRMLPDPEVMERHERTVHASPARVIRAVRSFRLEDSEVVGAIFRARELLFGLPRADRGTARPFLEQAAAMGWTTLDSIPGREVACGAVCQPWHGEVRFEGLPPVRFVAFRERGYAKIAWAIAADSLGPDLVRLRTETRVATTDPDSRRNFRRYWSQFSPGIFLIRLELLRVVAQEAERPESGASGVSRARR